MGKSDLAPPHELPWFTGELGFPLLNQLHRSVRKKKKSPNAALSTFELRIQLVNYLRVAIRAQLHVSLHFMISKSLVLFLRWRP